MKTNPFRLFNKGFGLIEILLVAIIIYFLSFFVIKTYFKNTALDESTKKALSEQGIDTSSQQSILDSTKERVQDINKQILDREKELEDFN